MKKWADYIDDFGLIIGLNFDYPPEHKLQHGDSLQRCGMWFIFAMKYLEKHCEKPEYIKTNFNVATYEECATYFLNMYFECYYNRAKEGAIERYPIRHPMYEFKGTGKTSRDQMMSNLWALLIIAINKDKKFSPTNQSRAENELEALWEKIKEDYFILPANDVLAPEHLAVWWRLWNYKKPSWYYKNLIRLGDYHSYLSTLVKIAEAKKTRYHTDDVNRICMLWGAQLTGMTSIGKKALLKYIDERPAWKPIGAHYHGKPNSEYEEDKTITGLEFAMKYYSQGQEAPWDEYLQAILK